MKRWFSAFIVTAIGVFSLCVLSAPVEAAPTMTPTIGVASPGTTPTIGQSATFTATVSGGTGDPTPTGSVSWAITGPGSPTCADSTLAAGNPANTATATCVISGVQAGLYSVTGTYVPGADPNYLPVGPSIAANMTIGKATPTITVAAPATTPMIGQSATFTATVAGPTGGPAPTGAVSWAITGPGSPTCANSTLATGNPANTATATCMINGVQAGLYSVTGTYVPGTDPNYLAVGPSTAAAMTVATVTPTITVTNNAAGVVTSGNFTFTAEISGSFGTPTGTVTWVVTGPSTVSCASAALDASGRATCAVSGALTGTYSATATYGGNATYSTVSGSDTSAPVGRATPTTPTVTNIPTGAVEFAGFTAVVGTTGDGTKSVVSTTPNTCTIGPDGLTVFFVSEGACTLIPSVAPGVNYYGATGSPQTFSLGPAPRGYWLVGSDGGIFSFGAATFHGSMGGMWLQRPVVGITPTLTRGGYWLVASDGGIFAFGDASFYGSVPGLGLRPAGSGLPNSLNAPIVGVVPTVTRHGYFMVASDGGVFAFGDARFEGSCPGIGGCAGTAVAVMPDHTGNGYWLVTSTGAVYAFGDATFYGTPPPDSIPVVDAVATPDGHGYWLLYANGAVTPFGDAANLGEPVGYVNSFNPATSIFPTADGKGYWVCTARGDVFSYGNAPYLGSESDAGLNGLIIAGFGF